jgi:3-oxoacyl-[acyl-carrier-protein] synthase II
MEKGCGWIKKDGCGCTKKGRQWQYTDLRSLYGRLQSDCVFAYPVDNFGRFNYESKLVAFAVALALYDADIRYAKGEKKDIGIVGTSPDGALVSNLEYFRDYVSCGRKLGRGNLFIYTLPSSPLAESAIHFGLQGPLLYLRYLQDAKQKMLEQARAMVKDNETPAVVAVDFNAQEAVCYCITGDTG